MAAPESSNPPRELAFTRNFDALAEAGILDDAELRYWRDGDKAGLYDLLRSGAKLDGIARDVIAAALLDVGHKRGAKPAPYVAQFVADPGLELPLLRCEVGLECEALRATGIVGYREQAMDNVAARHGVGVRTLERLLARWRGSTAGGSSTPESTP